MPPLALDQAQTRELAAGIRPGGSGRANACGEGRGTAILTLSTKEKARSVESGLSLSFSRARLGDGAARIRLTA